MDMRRYLPVTRRVQGIRDARPQPQHVVPRDAGRGQRRARPGKGEEPIAFDHDCREGICGTCSLVINGKPHGPHRGVASCQTYMRSFQRRRRHHRRAVPRAALPGDQGPDRQPQGLRPHHAGRAASSPCAPAARATRNALPVPKDDADLAMDAAACIGCGACVAACKNASAMLFVAAKAKPVNSRQMN